MREKERTKEALCTPRFPLQNIERLFTIFEAEITLFNCENFVNLYQILFWYKVYILLCESHFGFLYHQIVILQYFKLHSLQVALFLQFMSWKCQNRKQMASMPV